MKKTVKRPLTPEEKAHRRHAAARNGGARLVRKSENPVLCSVCLKKIHSDDLLEGRAYYSQTGSRRVFLCPECYKGGRP